MAKVLFVVPIGQDMGGIITSTEQYVQGIRDAGHEVTPICVVFTMRDAPRGPPPRGKFEKDFVPGEGTGWPMHPSAGWRSEDRVSLGCLYGIERFLALAKEHTIVIWASVYGFRNSGTEGSPQWLKPIKNHRTSQIFMIHDDHMEARYPWGMVLAKYATAFVGVQPCSYDSLENVSTARAMVYTPMAPGPLDVPPMGSRIGFLSCQIWKGWKRADALVAASPHMTRNSVTFAGEGIQLRYMRSPDKCPPRYAGIWDAMVKKQKYVGVLNEKERDRYLQSRRFLVDLSVRHNSGQLNRIVQEAMMQGCVVIANPEFISGGSRNDAPLIKPWVHYIPITEVDYGPKELAGALNMMHGETDNESYRKIQRAARGLAVHWDRKVLGQQLVDIGEGRPNPNVRFQRSTEDAVSKEAINEFVKVFGAKP